MEVINECADAWERLMTGKTPANGVSIKNVTVPNAIEHASAADMAEIPAHQELAPEKIDSTIDKWFFISGAAA